MSVLTWTATELQELLTARLVSSVDLVEKYLTQISKHNHAGLKINAVAFTAERETLLAHAERLDNECRQGHIRSPLHGIPILVKVLDLLPRVRFRENSD